MSQKKVLPEEERLKRLKQTRELIELQHFNERKMKAMKEANLI